MIGSSRYHTQYTMHLFCVTAVTVGAVIMAYSIYRYRQILKDMQLQIYDRSVFRNWIYGAAFLMMFFFLVGYAVVGIGFAFSDYHSVNAMIAIIFFFGAVFVLCMVRVQRVMIKTITDKSLQTIQLMISAIEAKDIYTKGHSDHVRNLSLLIYHHLPEEAKRRVNPAKLSDAAILHDIGKIGIPDEILNKPGKLTREEFEVIKTHPKRGKMLLENTCYRDVGDWILYHHEKLDGSGYYHLKGDEIPFEAQIISLADIFSAMYTDRVYRKRFTYEQVIDELNEMSGVGLDAELVSVFCQIDKAEVDAASVIFT